MKIRFIRNVLLEVEKPKLEEFWDKQFYKWDEVEVESIIRNSNCVTIITSTGDGLLDVPSDSFEILPL